MSTKRFIETRGRSVKQDALIDVSKQINLVNEDNIFSTNSTLENESPPRNRLLRNLESSLSPKFIGISSTSGGQRSRYGREQKYKENEGFLPTEVVYSYQKHKHPKSDLKINNSNLIIVKPLRRSAPDIFHESPIAKLINKNRELALINSPDDETILKNGFHKTKRNLFDANETLFAEDETLKIREIGKRKTMYDMKDKIINIPISSDFIEKLIIDEIPETLEVINFSEINLISPSKIIETNNNISSPISSDTKKKQNVRFSFKPGEIHWSRIGGYPYWPSVITPDEKGIVVTDSTFLPEFGQSKKVHVKFFADNGRRSWVALSSTIPYNGIKEFLEMKRSDEVVPKNRRKSKNNRPFNVPANKQELWQMAVNEAEKLLLHPLEKRLEVFDEITKENIQLKKQQQSEIIKKRRQSRKMELLKRVRSPTPESPSYEPIIPLGKKIKLENSDYLFSVFCNFSEATKNNQINNNNSSYNNLVLNELKASIDKDVAISYLHSKFMKNDPSIEPTPTSSNTFFETFKENYLQKYQQNNIEINESELQKFSDNLWNLRNTMEHKTPISDLNVDIKIEDELDEVEIKKELLSETSFTGESSSSIRTSLSVPCLSPGSSTPDTNMSEFSKNYLFKKLSREFACRICYKPDNLFKCEGICCGWYHKNCLKQFQDIKNTNTDKNVDKILTKKQYYGKNGYKHITSENANSIASLKEFLCDDCLRGESPYCFVCKGYNDIPEERLKCKFSNCGRWYHEKCLKYFPQAKVTHTKTIMCPTHSCHTCISDDPRGKYLSNDKLSYVRCVKCPSSYHMDSTCIPAGSEFITAIQIVCPKHRLNVKPHVNANWCFICAKGGSLICCETCPTAFHAECLKIPIPEEKGYICEECETGRLPLYGEIVWAKLGVYRWWPAQIIPPPAIPAKMQKLTRKQADFCVKFFGSNDFSWISRGRVYLYQEGDWGKIKNKKGLEKKYSEALEEAKKMYEVLNENRTKRNMEQKERLKPVPYLKIKSNKPIPPVKLIEDDISDINPCICNPKDKDPCGPDSGCLNRLLMIECHPKICLAGTRCLNQMFEKREYPKLEVRRTDSRGWGLMTKEHLKAGRFVVEYIGEIIDNEEFRRRVERKQEERDENYYFLTLNNNLMIDAGPKGNVARFMNHSCSPNCETQKWTVNGITRVGLFTLIDIAADTELTFNYNLTCMGEERKICHCGAEKCSGFIGTKYKDTTILSTSLGTSMTTRSGKTKNKKLKAKKKNKKKRN